MENNFTKRQRNEKGQFVKTHGLKKERIYRTWCAMKERCNNKHNKRFPVYGGRGICVSDEWNKNFMSFYNWAMANGYKEDLTIDRIDNNGNYDPSNCRWVDRKTQNRNYSRNHLINYNGETLCITDMAKKYGINRATVAFRIKQGKSVEEVFYKGDFRYGK